MVRPSTVVFESCGSHLVGPLSFKVKDPFAVVVPKFATTGV